LVLSSSGVVLEINQKGGNFYRTMRNIVERTYRCTFQLQYRIQSNDSKNQVIFKLHKAFPKQWLVRPVRLAITKTYNNNNKNNSKSNNSILWYLVFIYQYKNTLLSCYFFKKIMKIPEDERVDIRNMLVGMSKKVYNKMVKELDIIAS